MLPVTPLRIAHQVGHRLGRQMFGDGRFFARPVFPGMDRHQFVLVEYFDDGFRCCFSH